MICTVFYVFASIFLAMGNILPGFGYGPNDLREESNSEQPLKKMDMIQIK